MTHGDTFAVNKNSRRSFRSAGETTQRDPHTGGTQNSGVTPKMTLQAVTDDLRTAAGKADDVAAEITGNLKSLLAGIAPLEKDFRGGAGRSFQEVQTQVTNNLNKITDALLEVAEGVRSSGAHFDVQDQEAQELVAKTTADDSIIRAL